MDRNTEKRGRENPNYQRSSADEIVCVCVCVFNSSQFEIVCN